MTEVEARAAGLVQVTEYGLPGRQIETVHGEVEYGEWCRAEAKRLEAAGRKTAIVEDGRRVALFGSALPERPKGQHGGARWGQEGA